MQLKNLCPEKKKKKKSKQVTIFSQIFYRTAPSRGQRQQQHHPAREGTGDGDIALSHCAENAPISCCNQGSPAGTHITEKIFLSLCELLSRWAKDVTLTRGCPPGASSCVCALIKSTLKLVVTSFLAREIFPGLQRDTWYMKPLISLLAGY